MGTRAPDDTSGGPVAVEAAVCRRSPFGPVDAIKSGNGPCRGLGAADVGRAMVDVAAVADVAATDAYVVGLELVGGPPRTDV